MLQKIRDHSTGWLAGFLLVLLGLAFALWGIDLGSANQNFAATVNGDDIPIRDFQRVLQTQLRQYQQIYRDQLPLELEQQIREDVLDSFVDDTLISQHAASSGFRVSDRQVFDYLNQVPEFQRDGRYSSQLAESLLRNQGRSLAQFEETTRRSLQNAQVGAGLSASAFTTSPEARRALALRNQQREVEYLEIPIDGFLADATPDAATVEAHYEENSEQFMTPETLTIEAIEIRGADLGAEVDVSEETLRTFYQQEIETGSLLAPEQRRSSHILIEVEGDDEDVARSRAEELTERARNGEDFATLARENSDDVGSAQDGGDLGWATRDTFVGPFRDAVFAMDENEIRGPVRTGFGFHVIRLDGIRGEAPQSFEEARADLETRFKADRIDSIFYERARLLDEMAFENEDSLGPAADVLDIAITEVTGVTLESGTGIASDQRVRDAAFRDSVRLDGRNSPLIELEPDHVVVVRVTAVAAAERQPLDAVRSEIIDALQRDAARQAARAVADDIRERVVTGASLAAEAAAVGGTHTDKAFVGRRGSVTPLPVIESAFRTSLPAGGTPTAAVANLDDDRIAVVAIHSVRAGDAAGLDAAQRKAAARQIAAANAQSEISAYVQYLRNGATIQVRENLGDR